MRQFLWEGVEEGERSHLVSWDVVSKELSDGGLGIGNLANRNLALLTEWL